MAVEVAELAAAALEFEERSTQAAAARAQRVRSLAGNAAEEVHRTLQHRLYVRMHPAYYCLEIGIFVVAHMAYGFPVFIAPGSCCNSWCHAEQVKNVDVFSCYCTLFSPKEARVPLQTSCISIIPAISQPPVGLVRYKQHLVLKWA